MDKVIFEVSRGIILVCLGYIVGFFILNKVRNRKNVKRTTGHNVSESGDASRRTIDVSHLPDA